MKQSHAKAAAQVLWPSFWRNDPLSGERLSLFITLMDEILGEAPDLGTANVTFLDFSAPAPGQARVLSVLAANDIPRLNKDHKTELLERFVEAFLTAAHMALLPR